MIILDHAAALRAVERIAFDQLTPAGQLKQWLLEQPQLHLHRVNMRMGAGRYEMRWQIPPRRSAKCSTGDCLKLPLRARTTRTTPTPPPRTALVSD